MYLCMTYVCIYLLNLTHKERCSPVKLIVLIRWYSIAGRMVGMIYIVPAVALYRMGWIAQKYRNRLVAFAGLIAFQV